MSKPLALFLAAYILIALVTFGYAAARTDCDRPFRYIDKTDCQTSAGLAAGLAWPLYWSWDVAERAGAGSDRP